MFQGQLPRMRFERDNQVRGEHATSLAIGAGHFIKSVTTSENSWGAPRIHGEPLHLGFEVSERSVLRYLRSLPRTPRAGQTWTTFLRNHLGSIAAVDFFSRVLSARAIAHLVQWAASGWGRATVSASSGRRQPTDGGSSRHSPRRRAASAAAASSEPVGRRASAGNSDAR